MKKPTKLKLESEEISSRLTSGDQPFESSVLQEVAMMPSLGEVISVRAAKAHLSGLLDLVERGREIIITSNGKPKAKLVPMAASDGRKPFGGTWEHLATMPAWNGGQTAEEIIREDRDGRGW